MGASSSKTKFAAIGLGATVVVGSLLFFLLSEDSSEQKKVNAVPVTKTVEKKEQDSGPIISSVDPNNVGGMGGGAGADGQIDKSELMRVINLITEVGATAITDLKNECREERKQAVSDWEKYKELCVQHLQKQEMLVEELTREILSKNNIDENRFYYMMQAHMSNPEVMMAIQKMNSPSTSVPVDITKEKMREIFSFHLGKMEDMKQKNLGFQDFFLYAIKISDEIYFTFDLETEQIRPCIDFLKMHQDAEYVEYQAKLRAYSANQMPMGGF